jgi:hypothetical protein
MSSSPRRWPALTAWFGNSIVDQPHRNVNGRLAGDKSRTALASQVDSFAADVHITDLRPNLLDRVVNPVLSASQSITTDAPSRASVVAMETKGIRASANFALWHPLS